MKGEASVLNCTKGKKKPHIVNVQFTELLAKPIKETLIIQKPIDCKLNWKPIAGTVIINVCYTVFYNVKLGISFPHRRLWSTRFVWDYDSNQAAFIMLLCSQNNCDDNLMQPFLPTPVTFGVDRRGREVTWFYKVPATSQVLYITQPTSEKWLNYLVKHFWQPCLRTAHVVRNKPQLSEMLVCF